MTIFVDYETRTLKSLVSMGEQVIADTRELIADTQRYSSPFWKKERERMGKEIKKISAENKAYIAELKRRGEWRR